LPHPGIVIFEWISSPPAVTSNAPEIPPGWRSELIESLEPNSSWRNEVSAEAKRAYPQPDQKLMCTGRPPPPPWPWP
jgi:hypothetical protein